MTLAEQTEINPSKIKQVEFYLLYFIWGVDRTLSALFKEDGKR
jgi:hypothetical protein